MPCQVCDEQQNRQETEISSMLAGYGSLVFGIAEECPGRWWLFCEGFVDQQECPAIRKGGISDGGLEARCRT